MRGWVFVVLVFGLVLVAPLAAQAGRLEAVRLQGLALVPEPDGGGAMIRALKAGEVVTVSDRRGDYVAVTLADGTKGYVHGGFLTGFDDIAPMAAYAGRIDASVKRPASDAAKTQAAGDASASSRDAKTVRKDPGTKAVPTDPTVQAIRKDPAGQASTKGPVGSVPAYVPVADGGGLERFIANLSRPDASRSTGDLDSQIAEFNASKNRYSIEVRLSKRMLYLYENLPDGSRQLAKSYIVAVPGRDMEAPQGWGVVTGISFEPWWRPTQAMKERALKKGRQLPEVVKPGVKENPMGPFKIILSHGFGYRIHGNNNPGSIGRPVTSGCIRMRNDEGKDMAKMIDVGTEVVILQ